MKMPQWIKRLTPGLLVMAMTGGMLTTGAGCERKSDTERAVDKAKDKLDDARDKAKDAIEDAGDKIEDATD